MNKLSYKDLASALDVKQGTINMAVKRGKLESEDGDDGKKYIDVKKHINAIWLEHQMTKNGKTFDINRAINPVKKIEKKKDEKIDIDIPQVKEKPKGVISELAIKKAKLEVKKLQNADKLDRLKIEKMQGLLIPTDAARDVFMFSESTIITTFKQNIKSLLDIIQSRSGMSHAEYIEMNKEIDDQIDIIHETAKQNILNGLDGVVKEYQEVRSRGESK